MQDKPGGKPFDVIREIPLAPASTAAVGEAVRMLASLEAVNDAEADPPGRLRISYDASRVGLKDIEAMLDGAGIARAPGNWWRLKSAWYRFVDDNARANAHDRGAACCNRPPPASGSE